LRVIVAGGGVVGAVVRVAAPGEWRTNISLGGSRYPCVPSEEAASIAVAAAAPIGADLVGVDLLKVDDSYVALELNGAVEFDLGYSLPGADIYDDIARALELPSGRPLAALSSEL
jgi:glutathione synthase/RimK-type ligase-like ATP-grasp enzyme